MDVKHAWTLDAALQKRITAFEMKCYRKLLRIPHTAHRTNESVKEELTQRVAKVEMLVSIIIKRQLKWLGHVTTCNTRQNDSLGAREKGEGQTKGNMDAKY